MPHLHIHAVVPWSMQGGLQRTVWSFARPQRSERSGAVGSATKASQLQCHLFYLPSGASALTNQELHRLKIVNVIEIERPLCTLAVRKKMVSRGVVEMYVFKMKQIFFKKTTKNWTSNVHSVGCSTYCCCKSLTSLFKHTVGKSFHLTESPGSFNVQHVFVGGSTSGLRPRLGSETEVMRSCPVIDQPHFHRTTFFFHLSPFVWFSEATSWFENSSFFYFLESLTDCCCCDSLLNFENFTDVGATLNDGPWHCI